MPITPLAASIETAAHTAGELYTLLRNEREAIAGRQSETLAQLAARKEYLLGTLKTHGTSLRSTLASHALTMDMSDLPARLARLDPAAAYAWRDYATVLSACQRSNEENGILLARSRKQVESALSVLRGGSTASYDAHGSCQTDLSSRPIASA